MSGFHVFQGEVVGAFERRIRQFSSYQPIQERLSGGDYVLFAEIAEDHPSYSCKLTISISESGLGDRVGYVTGRQKYLYEFSVRDSADFQCKVSPSSVFHHTPISVGLMRVHDMDNCVADMVFDEARLRRFLRRNSVDKTITSLELTSSSKFMLKAADEAIREAMWLDLKNKESIAGEVPQLTLLQCATYAAAESAISILTATRANVLVRTPKRQFRLADLWRENGRRAALPLPLMLAQAGGEASSSASAFVTQLHIRPGSSLNEVLNSAMILANDLRRAQTTGTTTFSSSTTTTSTTTSSMILPCQLYRIVYDYQGATSKELTVHPGDMVRTLEMPGSDGWIKCETIPLAQVGFLPVWNLAPVPTSIPSTGTTASQTSRPVPRAVRPDPGESLAASADAGFRDVQFRVLAAFEARGPGELSVRRGEIVVGVQAPTEDGWFKVRISRPNSTTRNNTSSYGYVPFSYLRRNTEVTSLEPEASAPPLEEIRNPSFYESDSAFTGSERSRLNLANQQQTSSSSSLTGGASNKKPSSKQEQRAECAICFEEMHSAPVAVFEDLFGRKRTCRHFLHLSCAEDLVQANPGNTQCPICRVRFEQVKALPDFDSSPQEWFKLIDFEQNGSLSKQEVLDASKALFAVDYQALEHDVDRLWDQWTGNSRATGNGITYDQLCNPQGGLLVYVRRMFRLMEHGSGREPPSLIVDPGRWFEYFDEDCRGNLSKEEVLRGLVKTYNLGKEKPKQDALRKSLDEIWPVFCGSPDASCSVEQFIKGGGLADALVASFEGGTMSSPLLPSPNAALAEVGRSMFKQAGE